MDDNGRKRGRPAKHPSLLKLDYLIGWHPDSSAQRTGRPRKIQLSDRDICEVVHECIQKGTSLEQALRLLASWYLVDTEAHRLQLQDGNLKPSEAWDRADALLSAEPERAAREATRILYALRKRYPAACRNWIPVELRKI